MQKSILNPHWQNEDVLPQWLLQLVVNEKIKMHNGQRDIVAAYQSQEFKETTWRK